MKVDEPMVIPHTGTRTNRGVREAAGSFGSSSAQLGACFALGTGTERQEARVLSVWRAALLAAAKRDGRSASLYEECEDLDREGVATRANSPWNGPSPPLAEWPWDWAQAWISACVLLLLDELGRASASSQRARLLGSSGDSRARHPELAEQGLPPLKGRSISIHPDPWDLAVYAALVRARPAGGWLLSTDPREDAPGICARALPVERGFPHFVRLEPADGVRLGWCVLAGLASVEAQSFWLDPLPYGGGWNTEPPGRRLVPPAQNHLASWYVFQVRRSCKAEASAAAAGTRLLPRAFRDVCRAVGLDPVSLTREAEADLANALDPFRDGARRVGLEVSGAGSPLKKA